MLDNDTSEAIAHLIQTSMLQKAGDECFKNGDYGEAISLYNKAMNKCPKFCAEKLTILYQSRAAGCEKLALWEQVKEDCSKSLEYYQFFAKSYYLRAKAHKEKNCLMDCLEDLTAAKILGYEEEMSFFYNQTLELSARESMEKKIAEQQSKFPLPSSYTIKRYFQILKYDPVNRKISNKTNPKGYIRAKTEFHKGNYDQIISDCTEEIENTREFETNYKAEALLLRGEFHILSGNFKQGIQDLDAVINYEVESDHSLRANALIKRGSIRILLNLEDTKPGFDDFDEAEKIYPNNADVHVERGEIFIVFGQYSDAFREYAKAVTLAPNHTIAFIKKCHAEYCNAANTLSDVELTNVGNKILKKMKKWSNSVDASRLITLILTDQCKYKEVFSTNEKAIKLEPNIGDLYVYQGLLLMQWKNDIVGAIELINRAIEKDSKCKLAYEELANIELKRGCFQQSIELLDKTIALAVIPAEILSLYKTRNALSAEMIVKQKIDLKETPNLKHS